MVLLFTATGAQASQTGPPWTGIPAGRRVCAGGLGRRAGLTARQEVRGAYHRLLVPVRAAAAPAAPAAPAGAHAAGGAAAVRAGVGAGLLHTLLSGLLEVTLCGEKREEVTPHTEVMFHSNDTIFNLMPLPIEGRGEGMMKARFNVTVCHLRSCNENEEVN